MKKLTEKQMKSLYEMGGAEYARQEAWDIQQAAQALQFIASMCINELDEPDDIRSLSNIMIQLMEFINGEIKEMVQSAKEGEAEKNTPAIISISDPKANNLNLSYAKSIGLSSVPDFLSVKFVAKDEIKGYTFQWGNPSMTDLEAE